MSYEKVEGGDVDDFARQDAEGEALEADETIAFVTGEEWGGKWLQARIEETDMLGRAADRLSDALMFLSHRVYSVESKLRKLIGVPDPATITWHESDEDSDGDGFRVRYIELDDLDGPG